MKKQVAISFVTLMAGSLTIAQAEIPEQTIYGGIGLGASKFSFFRDLNVPNIEETRVLGGKLFLGRSFGERYAAEVAYRNLGSFNAGPLNSKVKNFSFSGLVRGKVSPGVELFGKLGMHIWNETETRKYTGFSDSSAAKGLNLFLGVGVNAYVGRDLSVRAEYEFFPMTDEGDNTYHLDFLSVSIIKKF